MSTGPRRLLQPPTRRRGARRRSSGRRTPNAGRLRLALLAAAVLLGVAVFVAVQSGGGHPGLPLPGIGRPARPGDPFAYDSAHAADFIARATAGEAHVLFTQSPGGALATAARVARWRSAIDRAVTGTGIDPALVEGMVFLESAGRPDAIAGPGADAASGLTQILASTGQTLLGMHIDLAASRNLTGRILAAESRGDTATAARLSARRVAVDDRFNPPRALAGTVRYLEIARSRFGRADLAVESYHMGMGNLENVLSDYDGGTAVPYVQLYFDTAPDHHPSAFRLLQSFGDDSSLYLWRVLGAMQIMALFRADRPALARLSGLQLAAPSNAYVLHPPDRTASFPDPNALYGGYAARTLLPLPRDPSRLDLAYNPLIGWQAPHFGVPRALYRGLAPDALDMLIELAARVAALSGRRAPLELYSAVIDRRYAGLIGAPAPAADTGYTFQIARRYAGTGQAEAFQAMLDRLQALNLIAWDRTPTTIDVTVAAGAGRVIADGVGPPAPG